MVSLSPLRVGVGATVALLLASAAVIATSQAEAQSPQIEITETEAQRCISSNGVPAHEIGQFPNSGNPHRFEPQNHRFCVPKIPVKTAAKTDRVPIVGVILNGVPIRPGTADWYDPSSPRGFSRDRSSGWNLEGMGSADALGMDANNAHVDNRGVYHYHGAPTGFVAEAETSLIGYAADGHEIHYLGESVTASYRLKGGERPTAPFGAYDGSYVQDWEYVAGSGDLDECNGGELDGRYVYFATHSYPFFPRCFWGEVSADFQRPGGGAPGMAQRRGPRHGHPPHRRSGFRDGPPPRPFDPLR